EAASLWTGTAVPTWRGSLYPHWSLARGTIQWIPTTWHGWRTRSRMGNISFARTVATSRFTMTSRPTSTGSFNLSETLLRAVLCLALMRAQVWPLARTRDARQKRHMASRHLHAVMLLEEYAADDRWLTSNGWSDHPTPEAGDLPGGFALPGLVDAHSHVSFDMGSADPIP